VSERGKFSIGELTQQPAKSVLRQQLPSRSMQIVFPPDRQFDGR